MFGLTPGATDLFANKLWTEENNYCGLMNDPTLWSDKKRRYMQDVNRHLNKKRILLKDVTGSRTVTHHSLVKTTTTTTTPSSNITDLDEDDFSDLASPFNHVAPVSSPLQTTTSPSKNMPPPPPTPLPTAPPPSIPPSTLHPFFQSGHKPSTATLSSSTTLPPPRLDIPTHARCKCGQYKFNQSCPSKLCQKCCGNSMDHCTVTTHVKCKPVGYAATKYKSTPTPTTPLPDIPGVVDHLTNAIKEGRPVFIAYANHNSNEKQARKVKPLQWIRYGEAFKALCFIDDIEKTFNTHKILRIQDQVWTTGITYIYTHLHVLTFVPNRKRCDSTTSNSSICGRLAYWNGAGSLLAIIQRWRL